MIAARRSVLIGVWVCGALMVGCGGEEGSSPVQSGDAPVIRPATVESLALDLSQQTLPAALGGADLLLARDVSLGTIAGGQGGLFLQGAGGFEQIDEAPVSGVVALAGVGILIGREEGLRIWDGALKGTSLDDAIEGPVTALAARGDEVWIATGEALFLLGGEALSAFEGLGGITSISTFAGSSDVLLRDAEGELMVLRAEGESWSIKALSGEPVQDALPGAGDRILGLDGGALVERVEVGGGEVAWRRVALSEDVQDEGAEGIEAIAVDPGSGALWVVDGAKVARIEGGTVSSAARPEGMGEVVQALVTGGGVLWLSDGSGLWSAGGEGETISFETHIAPFSAANCERCHVENGVARLLVTYDNWVEESAGILTQLETGAMPADGRALVGGSADLVRRWIEGGLQE